MKMKKTLLLIIFLSLFICCVICIWQMFFLSASNANEQKIFVVEKGENFLRVAQNLKNENLIKNKLFFSGYIVLIRAQSQIKAGQYLLSPSMNIPQIAGKLIGGEIVRLTLTFREGLTISEMEEQMVKRGMDVRDEMTSKKTEDYKSKFNFLSDAPNQANLEGYLFPDTYQLVLGENSDGIILKMLTNFENKLTADMRAEISRQKKSIFDIIIMASMLEKEVKTIEDKKIVSGILWKRMSIGMPLQVDATITYLTKRKSTVIMMAELKIDSPYNTYKYKGLPSGPICNPGLESIIAAIYPQKSNYLFYLSTPEGRTIFSETAQEHGAAREKYLK